MTSAADVTRAPAPRRRFVLWRLLVGVWRTIGDIDHDAKMFLGFGSMVLAPIADCWIWVCDIEAKWVKVTLLSLIVPFDIIGGVFLIFWVAACTWDIFLWLKDFIRRIKDNTPQE